MVGLLTVAIGISTLATTIMLRNFLRRQDFFCNCPPLSGAPRVVITGATSGIGLAAAYEFARLGWNLVLGCRNLEAGDAVKRCLTEKYEAFNATVYHLDLTDLYSIKQFASNVSLNGSVDILINNAGIMAAQRRIHSDLYLDSNMLTNFIGPFCLFQELLPYFT